MPVVNVKGLGLMRVAQQATRDNPPAALAGLYSRADKQQAWDNKVQGGLQWAGDQLADVALDEYGELNDPAKLKAALDNKFQEVRGFVDMATQGLTPLQKAAFLTTGMQGINDFASLLADGEMYIKDPESRTWFNAAMTGTGVAGGAMTVSPAMASILPMVKGNISQFQNRVNRLKAAGVDTDQRWFHASTHNIEEFDNVDLQNAESHFGKGTYLTSDPYDASKNYGSLEGQDLTQRVQGRAEQIANDADWDYDDPRALKQAQEELIGDNLGVVYPVHTKNEKPFDISSDGDAFLKYEQPEYDPKDFLDEAENSTSYTRDDFDTDAEWREQLLEEADDLAREDSYNFEPEGELVDFFDSLRNNPQTGDDIHDLIATIQDSGMDGGISGKDLDEIMRKGEWYADGDMGEMANNEVYRQAIQDAGFDSIIHDGDIFEGMDIPYGTKHQIVFDPENIAGQFSGGKLGNE
jgi:hypothetical protein